MSLGNRKSHAVARAWAWAWARAWTRAWASVPRSKQNGAEKTSVTCLADPAQPGTLCPLSS